MTRTKWVVFVVITALTGSLLFFFLKDGKKPGLEDVTIVQAGDFFLYAPLYIAADAGHFEHNGVRANIVSSGGDEKTWATVLSGSAEFGVADPTFVAISDARGQSGKVIASVVNGVPFWGVTLREDLRPFKSAKDLKGLTIGTFPAPSTAYTLQKQMFDDAGLPPSIREGPFGTLLAMLEAKKADVVLELEPNVSQAVQKQNAKVLYSLADLYGDFAITGLTTRPELLKERPELIRKVVCSLQMAMDYIRTEPEKSLEILVKRFPEVNRSVAKAAFDRVVAARIIPETPVVSEKAWERAIALRIKAGELKDPRSFSHYVENQYARHAEKECRLRGRNGK